MLRPGDIVRLKTGEKPLVIVDQRHLSGHCKLVYLSSSMMETSEPLSRLMPYGRKLEIDEEERLEMLRSEFNIPEKEETMTTLYETKEKKPRFGTKIGTNTAGKIVLEMKGAKGEVELFNSDEIQEVVPYTVEIEFDDTHSRTYHYTTQAGRVEVGDAIVLSNGSRATVIAVDTKSKKAKNELSGRKFVTTEI